MLHVLTADAKRVLLCLAGSVDCAAAMSQETVSPQKRRSVDTDMETESDSETQDVLGDCRIHVRPAAMRLSNHVLCT